MASRALRGRFRDQEHGGWYAKVGAEGPTTTDKTAYEHAFVVLAAASATAAGRPGGRELLDEALDVLLEHFWDDDFGMVVEQWDESFSTLDPYRGVNANMHTVEALLSAADVLDDPGLRDRALRILTRVVHELAASHEWRIPEHFDESWTPILEYNRDDAGRPVPARTARRSGTGWSGRGWRCTCAPGWAMQHPDWLLDDARSLFDASVREGWAVDGADGFVYTVDWSGQPVVRERMHWVAAEATAAAAALHAATGDPSYERWYQQWWQHIDTCFRDPEHGSWHHELSPTEQAERPHLAGKAGHLPRLPGDPDPATPADPDAGEGPGRRPARLTGSATDVAWGRNHRWSSSERSERSDETKAVRGAGP